MFKSPKIFFHLLKSPDPSYLVLKFSNILSINNWDMAQNVILQRSWPWKVKVIGQNKQHHQMPWPWKHICKCQNRHPKCLSWKVMAKDVFFLNGGKRNTFANVTRSKLLKMFFLFIERPRPKLPSVKIWWWFVQQEPRYGPKYDFTFLWPWKVKVIREVNNILHCNPHITHEHTCEVSLRSYWQFLWKTCAQFAQKWPGEERKKEERRTLGETVWRTLTLCDANYTMKERSDVKVTNIWFEDLSLNFHLAQVGSQYIEPL